MTPIFSLENIHRQYLHCRRNKRNTINALKFEYGLEENLLRLQEELHQQIYTPSRSVCFVVTRPKLREIFAADFRDRVVHHILVDALEKVWEPRFIHDSYACRKAKGTHRAVKRLQTFMRRVSRNSTRRAYFIQLDIQGFFFNIEKEVLYQIIAKRISNEQILWLARTLIFHDCTKNAVVKGKKGLLKKVPSHKTLFNTENKRGLPIGNLTSQFFANVYLNEVDQFVKHHLKTKYYIRYCDDFVLLHEEKERLLEWREEIKEFLKARLRLTLNEPRQTLGPISNGIDFLGYIVRPHYLLVRRRVVNRLKAKLSEYQKTLIRQARHCTVFRYDHAQLEKLMATWSSYMAHLKMANTYSLRKKLLDRFSWFGYLYHQKEEKLKMMDEVPARLQSLKGQYRFFLGKCRGSILFFQVGRFYEFYDRQAEIAMEILALKRMKVTRGFRTRCGFPVRFKERYLKRLMRSGFFVHIIGEEEGWLPGLKKRHIAEGWLLVSEVANR